MRVLRGCVKVVALVAGLAGSVLVVPVASTVGAAPDPAVFSVESTSEPSTPETSGTPGDEVPVAVGEEVVFRIEFEMQESTTITLTVDHVVPAEMEYVAGSAYVSYLASTLPSLNGDFAGITNTSTPDLAFPAARVSFDGGTRMLRFDFGSVINNDGDSDAEWFIIEFAAVVQNQPTVARGDWMWVGFDVVIDEGFPTQEIFSSSDLHLEVVEPELTASAVYAPDAHARGTTSTLTIDVANLAADGANGPVHDVVVAETFDDWLHIVSVDVAFNGAATTFGSTFTDNSVITPGFAPGVEDDLSVTISALPVDGTATVTVTVQSNPAAAVASLPRTITTSVDIDGDSLSESAFPFTQQRPYSTSADDDLTVFRAPIASVTTMASDPTNDTAIPFTVTFDEDVTGFTAGGIALSAPAGSAITNFVAVDAVTYTFDVSGMTADGDVTVHVAAGAATNGDGRTNLESESETVTYDGTPPEFTGPAEGSTVPATAASGEAGAEVEFSVEADQVECTPASGSFFPIGTTEVTCTAEDAAGNTAVLSFSVEVSDDEAPTIADNPDIELQLARGSSTVAVTFSLPAASDNSGTVEVECDLLSGSSLPVGTHVVTCTATDPSDNTASSSFVVTVLRARSIPETGGDVWAGVRLGALMVAGGAVLVAGGAIRRRRRPA